MSVSKDTRALARKIRQYGWTLEIRANGHLRFNGPDGQFVTTAATPSDPRYIRYLKNDLRRAGCPI